jgi:hypothetical protein
MNDSNAELIDIIPFKEDGCWYLKLIYKYEDEQGKHTVAIPKAAIPFNQWYIPHINIPQSYYRCSSEKPYIECSDSMLLYDSTFELATKRGVKRNGCYFDIITEYAAKEMTLDEIEKELGYKVKIINKEDKENK